MQKRYLLYPTLAGVSFLWSFLGLLPFLSPGLPLPLTYGMVSPFLLYITPLMELRTSSWQFLLFTCWWLALMTGITSSLFFNILVVVSQSLPQGMLPLPLLTLFFTGICFMERLLQYQKFHFSLLKEQERREEFKYVHDTLIELEETEGE